MAARPKGRITLGVNGTPSQIQNEISVRKEKTIPVHLLTRKKVKPHQILRQSSLKSESKLSPQQSLQQMFRCLMVTIRGSQANNSPQLLIPRNPLPVPITGEESPGGTSMSQRRILKGNTPKKSKKS